MPQYQFDLIAQNHERWLKGSDLSERADFSGMTLQQIKAICVDLSGAIFNGTKLFSCDFTGADLSDITAKGLCCYDTDFSNATFKNAHMPRAEFTETVFSKTDLWNVSGGL